MSVAMHNSAALTLACLLSVVCITPGCTPTRAGPKRGKLEGNVTLNGKPVEKGYIRLLAVDPNGTNAAAEIVAGKYTIPDTQGPTKGKYRVTFSVPIKKRIPNDDAPGEMMDNFVETLPPKYHSASTIMLDYDPDKPEPRDFQLTTP
jgi:hypothetical protein